MLKNLMFLSGPITNLHAPFSASDLAISQPTMIRSSSSPVAHPFPEVHIVAVPKHRKNRDRPDLWMIRFQPQIGEQQRFAGWLRAPTLWFDCYKNSV